MGRSHARDPMDRQTVPLSFLPSLIMPCPYCGQRMIVKSVLTPAFHCDFEEVTHGCKQCGTELTRTIRSETELH